ncbi:MAG: glycoside hydrolase family 1 protein [Candidatus Moranbacteria bacterium]|nr:glycoside hydrolase family 1 protein [Candidatus Moranbacteria bacterium]
MNKQITKDNGQNTKNKMGEKFPEGFLWGVAYSSHQVEGNNNNNDWWEWEQKGKAKDKSGKACDSWNLYETDHDLARDLGCGGFRLSLEWSRIEPKEGEFSQEAIEHYRKVLQDIRRKGMKTVVTLWHWPLPLWFSHEYGWHKRESVDYFKKYCQKAVQELGSEIDIFITMNEPMVPLSAGFLVGRFPPGKINPWLFRKAKKNMISAHKECYRVVKNIHQDLPVGITQLYNYFEPYSDFFLWKFLSKKVAHWYNYDFLDKIDGYQDFVGLDYYFHDKIKLSFKAPFYQQNENEKVSDLGWEIYPRGIYEITKDAWQRYQKPIYILENGLADKEDKYRKEFIENHLKRLHGAIEEGADVRGYFHWSLIDNFEWLEGFEPRFGLCEMNYDTMERKIRPSARRYAEICKNNAL